MSKTLGNSPDPLDLIATYGADGLRFGLQRIAPTGQDIRFDEKQIEEGRNFGNKLWNACRFRAMQGDPGAEVTVEDLSKMELQPYQVSILARLNECIAAIEQGYQDYRFPLIAQALYDFAWSGFCDWYLESAKKDMNKPEGSPERDTALAVIDCVLNNFLRLLHPYMPHLTSELWSLLGFRAPNHFREPEKNFLMFATWPEALDLEKAAAGCEFSVEKSVEMTRKAYEAATLGRQLRAEYNVATNKKVRFILSPQVDWATAEIELLSTLMNASEIDPRPSPAIDAGTPHVLTPLGELYMPLAGVIDVEAEKERLNKEIGKVTREIEKGTKMLNNPSFTEKAPEDVVQEHQGRLKEHKNKLQRLRKMLKALG
jgi:valyl-tRNA synthetase